MSYSEKGKLKHEYFNLYSDQKVIYRSGTYYKPHELFDLSNEVLGVSPSIYAELKHVSQITYAEIVEIVQIILNYNFRLISGEREENLLFYKEPKILGLRYSKIQSMETLFVTYALNKNHANAETMNIDFDNAPQKFTDFIRKKGYATPYLELNVNDLIELNFLRLDNKSEVPVTFEKVFVIEEWYKPKSMYDRIVEFTKSLRSQPVIFENNKTSRLKELNVVELKTECVKGYSDVMHCGNSNRCEKCKNNFFIHS